MGAELNFRNWGKQGSVYDYYDHSITVSVINRSSAESIIGSFDSDCWAGIMVNGNNKVNVVVDNITIKGYYYAFYTNGSCEGAIISVSDSKMEAGNAEEGIGVYLAGLYTYSFDDCDIKGSTGYYTKSGYHAIIDCDIEATKTTHKAPQHNGSGANGTGSGIVVDSATGYKDPIEMQIKDCEIKSKDGYAIEEIATSADPATAVYYSTITLGSGEDSNVYIVKEELAQTPNALKQED